MTEFDAVRELRKRLNLTQQEFAHQTKLSQRTISVYERGKTPTSDGVLFKFAKLAFERGYEDLAQILIPRDSSGNDVNTDGDELSEIFHRIMAKHLEIARKHDELKLLLDELSRRMRSYSRLL